MKSRFWKILPGLLVVATFFFLLLGAGPFRSTDDSHVATIKVDYPLEGSIFPPEITSPTFLWHDPVQNAKKWVVEVSFADGSAPIRVETPAPHPQVGEIDELAGNGQLVMSPEQAAARSWKPDEDTWATIKKLSQKSPATFTITGYADEDAKMPVSSGKVTITTSLDPVGAPIFYRDVPLMTSPPLKNGSIQPLPTFALPMIKWRIRDISQPQSHVVMTKLYSCANCHSFSLDGKTMGLDVDGPQNDKGMYALLPISKHVTMRNENVIKWSSMIENPGSASAEPAKKRFGFMSQVSPEGRYVVTSIPAPGAKAGQQAPDFAGPLADRLFSVNYMDIKFTQVFYPTRGILAYYDRVTKQLRRLPGADDPNYVQTSAFWSPDGKYLIFSRAKARPPYPAGATKPVYAEDPNETQVQYDLYRIPFNEGRGGTPEPVVGASNNGMSNSFPKVSPDGKWIVWVQAKNGLLMRPDSKLYMVPFEGGKPRLMNCNTPLMNSWHTFSPNGRWLAFSSKARSPYTRLMLTHIDENGNDSPAIMIENSTAANRAVNIPEFVNVKAGEFEDIDPQATVFFTITNEAAELMTEEKTSDAIEKWQEALRLQPDDALTHFSLALAYTKNNQERDAVPEYRKAIALNQKQWSWFAHYAMALANTGDLRGAELNYRKSLALDPTNAWVQADLGTILLQTGRTQEAFVHLRKAVELDPKFAPAHNQLASALAKTGRTSEAVQQLQKAVELDPESAEYRFNLGFVLGMKHDFPGAVTALEKAVELTDHKDSRCLAALAEAYEKTGQSAQAVQSAREALEIAVQQNDKETEAELRNALEHYQRQSPAGNSQ